VSKELHAWAKFTRNETLLCVFETYSILCLPVLNGIKWCSTLGVGGYRKYKILVSAGALSSIQCFYTVGWMTGCLEFFLYNNFSNQVKGFISKYSAQSGQL